VVGNGAVGESHEAASIGGPPPKKGRTTTLLRGERNRGKGDTDMNSHRESKRPNWPDVLALGLALCWAGVASGQTPWVGQDSGATVEPVGWQNRNELPNAPTSTLDAPQSTTYWVAMPDGILLATEVSLPTTPEPYPTVLVRTPYSRFNPGGVGVNVDLYLQEGYAVVVQETRGRWDSQGTWYFWKDDPADGHATIEWIAQQSWSNGKVGMLGRSGAGVTQYAVAQGAPAPLKCLAPAHESPDRYHLAFQGGALFYNLVYYWLHNNGLGYLYDVLLEHRLWDDWYDDWLASPDTVQVPSFHMGRRCGST